MSETATQRLGGSRSDALLSGTTFDTIVTVLSVLMVAGVVADFRSHAEGISFAEEGFLTPEHVFFYSMFLGIAAVIGARTVLNRRDGATWLAAIPAGYGAGLLGVVLFGFGGFGDFLWHSAFGFEESTEALISPSHLMLATGAGLFLSSPARAIWRREAVTGGWSVLPAIVGGGLTLTIAVFFTGYVNPIMQPYALFPTPRSVSLGIASFIVFSALVVGTMLLFARRFDLPPGALTLLVLVPAGASTVPMGFFRFLPAALVMGLVADGLVRVAPPAVDRPRSLRLFGAAVPVAFAATYLLPLAATGALFWTVHVWAGAIVYAGLSGLLLTYFLRPTARWQA